MSLLDDAGQPVGIQQIQNSSGLPRRPVPGPSWTDLKPPTCSLLLFLDLTWQQRSGLVKHEVNKMGWFYFLIFSTESGLKRSNRVKWSLSFSTEATLWWPLTWWLSLLWLFSFKLLFIITSAPVSPWPFMLYSLEAVLVKDEWFCFSLKPEPSGSAALSSEILSQIPGVLQASCLLLSWTTCQQRHDEVFLIQRSGELRVLKNKGFCLRPESVFSTLMWLTGCGGVRGLDLDHQDSLVSSWFLYCCTGNMFMVLNFTQVRTCQCNKRVRIPELKLRFKFFFSSSNENWLECPPDGHLSCYVRIVLQDTCPLLSCGVTESCDVGVFCLSGWGSERSVSFSSLILRQREQRAESLPDSFSCWLLGEARLWQKEKLSHVQFMSNLLWNRILLPLFTKKVFVSAVCPVILYWTF